VRIGGRGNGIVSWINSAFEHIPEAAASPRALVAYLGAVVAGAILSYQIARNRSQQKLILALPEDKRDERVREIIGKPFPAKFSGEQWLRHKRYQLILAGIGLICATLVIVFAIAAATASSPVITGPVITEIPAPPPTPIETDAALLERFDLKLDKDFVRNLFGVPNWTTSTQVQSQDGQSFATMPIEIYSKNGYNLTVGYDEENKVNIYSLVPTDEMFLKTSAPQTAVLNKTFAELGADAFVAKDMSPKFYYYAEGHFGMTEAEGHVSDVYFYTDTGLEHQGEEYLLPPSNESDNLTQGDTPVQSDDAKKWRAKAKPNGYLRAREGVDIDSVFFHDMNWKSVVS